MSDLATRLRLLKALGTGPQQMDQVDIARGVTPGTPNPMFQGMHPNDLALFDRLAWGQQMQHLYGKVPAALSGALMGGGYEAVKGVNKYGPAGDRLLTSFLLHAAGQGVGGDAPAFMKRDKTTSDPSLMNALAILYGAVR